MLGNVVERAGEAKVRQLLESVSDPEIPVLSINDLGVVRGISVVGGEEGGSAVTVTITPTYSGCPAMGVIEMEIRDCLIREGYHDVSVETVLSPAWTTDWLSDAGRRKLKEYGIAPPEKGANQGKAALFGEGPSVTCPRCEAKGAKRLSEFGATACKALYQCQSCDELFDYFKCI